MTYYLFTAVLLFVIGNMLGKLFKGWNPFKVLLGLFILACFLAFMEEMDETYVYIAFAIGFLFNFGNPKSIFDGIFSEFKMGYMLSKAKKKALDDVEEARENLYREKAEIEQELERQRREAEDAIRRAAEELRQRQEAFRREQERASGYRNSHKKEQKQQAQKESPKRKNSNERSWFDLDTSKFSDACIILGIKETDDLKTAKKAYRKLMKIYHPDNIAHLNNPKAEKEAKEMAQIVNAAFQTVEKKFKK